MTQPMSLDEALALLGLNRTSSRLAAESAYRAHASVLDPDQIHGMTQEQADRLLAELDEAWVVVDAHLDQRAGLLPAAAVPEAQPAATYLPPGAHPPAYAPPPGAAPGPWGPQGWPPPAGPMSRREWRAAERRARAASGQRGAHPVRIVLAVVLAVVVYRVSNAILWGLFG